MLQCLGDKPCHFILRVEVVRLGEAARIDDRGANPPLEDERPLGCGGVPVELAHRSGLDPHRNPGNSLRDRQLRDGCLFPVARRPVRGRCGPFGFEVVLQDRIDGSEGARADFQRPAAGCLQPVAAIALDQPDDADSGPESLLRVRALAQDGLDQRRGIATDLAGLPPDPLRRPVGIAPIGCSACAHAPWCAVGPMTIAYEPRPDCRDGRPRWCAP